MYVLKIKYLYTYIYIYTGEMLSKIEIKISEGTNESKMAS
jgi:hypothetical protein